MPKECYFFVKKRFFQLSPSEFSLTKKKTNMGVLRIKASITRWCFKLIILSHHNQPLSPLGSIGCPPVPSNSHGREPKHWQRPGEAHSSNWCSIVNRGECLWRLANIKGANKDGKIYVGRSTTVQFIKIDYLCLEKETFCCAVKFFFNNTWTL